MSPKTLGIYLAIFSAIAYGLNPLGALFLYEENLNVLSVVFYRFLFASIILALFLLYKKQNFFVSFKELLILILLGVLFAFSAITLYSSFLFMDAGLASTILFIYPVFVAILMAVFYKEKSTFIEIFSIALAFLGVMLLASSKEANISYIGILLVVSTSFLYSIYIIIVNQYVKTTALKTTFYSMLFCTITIFIISFFQDSYHLQALTNFNMWFFTLFLALIPTVISLLFLVKAIQLIGSTNASILGALEPLTAVFIGVFVFNEKLTFILICGIILIIFAVFLIILKDRIFKILNKKSKEL